VKFNRIGLVRMHKELPQVINGCLGLLNGCLCLLDG